ncbi:hypothetical protein HID58_031928 [Brassica napus]|uniref:Zinc knuckle CX2CX4HX4C domain-containing protein n=1 Tax=Brassica napus TaxID=3708 RepID=A0ABQ8BUW0_BRANA|nr:hypothetical protein HID58_031928 [Brassica napus]
MRVHVDGLLPLLTTSVVDFPNGDSVTTTLVYERLDKHCTKCKKLDHDVKECLVARAEAKAKEASRDGNSSRMDVNQSNGIDSTKAKSNMVESGKRYERPYQSPTPQSRREYDQRPVHSSRDSMRQRAYKPHSMTWQERGSQRRSSQARDRGRVERIPRELSTQRPPLAPPTRSYYREVYRAIPEVKDTASSASKSASKASERGFPRQERRDAIPQEVYNEALGTAREAMMQYTLCADPSEREARKERMRKAEESGQIDNTARMIARSAAKSTAEDDQPASPPPRPPVLQRLGPSPSEKVTELGDSLSDHSTRSQDRLPVTLRLGLPEARQSIGEEMDSQELRSSERLPASQRLGPPHPREPASVVVAPATNQRKPGRPPGSGKIKEKKTTSVVAPKRRTVSQKPSPY